MKKTRPIPFAELRQFLQGLGYKEKLTHNAHVLDIKDDKLLIFRRYGDQEEVALRDLLNTRKYLDWWGLMEADDFDAFLERTATSA